MTKTTIHLFWKAGITPKQAREYLHDALSNLKGGGWQEIHYFDDNGNEVDGKSEGEA